MNESEFDKFADEYAALHEKSLSFSGCSPDYFAEYKIIDIAREWKQHARSADASIRILDFGAGTGGSVPYVAKHLPGAQLTCLDLSRRSLEIAGKRFPTQAQFVHFDGTQIPFPSDHFDIAYAMCVFHHIDPSEHPGVLQELRRVIKPGGSLFVFEHNPLNPLTVRVVNQCPFDENAQLIRASDMKHQLLAAGFAQTKIKYRVFFPQPLSMLRPAEAALAWLPLGGQYYAMSHK